MKLLGVRFFAGAAIEGIGSFGVVVGALLMIPPAEHVLFAGLLIVVGAVMAHFGHRLAKDSPKPASKVEVETLRKAGLLSKNNK